MNQAIKGNILTPSGWLNGTISFAERIADVAGNSADPKLNGDDYILPGFIDLHVHGGAGKDVMEGGDAVHAIAAIHARHGTTSMLATTMTAPPEDIEVALAAIGKAVRQRGKGEARVLGAHLEGPYINSGKLGAQPNCARRRDRRSPSPGKAGPDARNHRRAGNFGPPGTGARPGQPRRAGPDRPHAGLL